MIDTSQKRTSKPALTLAALDNRLSAAVDAA